LATKVAKARETSESVIPAVKGFEHALNSNSEEPLFDFLVCNKSKTWRSSL